MCSVTLGKMHAFICRSPFAIHGQMIGDALNVIVGNIFRRCSKLLSSLLAYIARDGTFRLEFDHDIVKSRPYRPQSAVAKGNCMSVIIMPSPHRAYIYRHYAMITVVCPSVCPSRTER